MRLDDSTPLGPAECPNCPGQHHWPHNCQNTPEQQRERRTQLEQIIADLPPGLHNDGRMTRGRRGY